MNLTTFQLTRVFKRKYVYVFVSRKEREGAEACYNCMHELKSKK